MYSSTVLIQQQMWWQWHPVYRFKYLSDGLVGWLVAVQVQRAAIENRIAFTLGLKQTSLVHYLQVVAHTGLAHIKQLAELQNSERIPSQHTQNLQPQRIPARFEDRGQCVHGGQVVGVCVHGCHGNEV